MSVFPTNDISAQQAGVDFSAISTLNKKGAKLNPKQAEAAATDFESVFLAQMLEQMFGESSGEEAFGDSETNDIYKGMMMQEYGKTITKAGGIGIADYVKRELLKLQEH